MQKPVESCCRARLDFSNFQLSDLWVLEQEKPILLPPTVFSYIYSATQCS